MRFSLPLLLAIACAALGIVPAGAVTPLPSADGQFWDVQDTSPWAQDSGGIATGGAANPFNGFGYLKLEAGRPGPPAVSNLYLRGFGLAHDGAERFDSITPVMHEGVVVARAIFAPKDTTYLRYFDSFTNTSAEPRAVRVAWGGATGVFEDGGRVTVRLAREQDRLAVSVEDNGPGIPPEESEAVFDRFHQLRGDGAGGKPKGWGLGLTICRQIVEHFGGRIWAEPAHPRGTVFRFTLPTALAPAGED